MSVIYLGLVGTLTGLHAATLGAFKDSPFEGFRVSSFLRSVVLGLAAGLGFAAAGHIEATWSPLILVGDSSPSARRLSSSDATKSWLRAGWPRTRPVTRRGRCSRLSSSWSPGWSVRAVTNQEVAHQLVLSVKTVGYHLSNVYTKLGLHSRTQLVAALSRPT